MSTKIYYGFRFIPTEWEEINKAILEIRESSKTVVVENLQKLVDAMIADLREAGQPIDSTKIKSKISELTREAASSNHRSLLDLTSSVCVYPFEGRIYGVAFAELNHLRDPIMDHPAIEYFGYWNNTDPDERCSEEEWAERERVWDAILKNENGMSFAEAGYVREIISSTAVSSMAWFDVSIENEDRDRTVQG